MEEGQVQFGDCREIITSCLNALFCFACFCIALFWLNHNLCLCVKLGFGQHKDTPKSILLFVYFILLEFIEPLSIMDPNPNINASHAERCIHDN